MAAPDLAEVVADLTTTVADLAVEVHRLHPRVAYRVEDAADMVGVSRSDLYRMVKDGTVRKVPDMGVRVIIPHSELVRVFGTPDARLEVAS